MMNFLALAWMAAEDYWRVVAAQIAAAG